MALYEVTRTDDVQPGELVSALVIAGGVAKARGRVQHLTGATPTNVVAERIDTTGDEMLATYFDERDPEPVYPSENEAGSSDGTTEDAYGITADADVF